MAANLMVSKLGLTAQEERDLRTVFKVFDTTDRGILDAEDLRRLRAHLV